MLTPEVIHVHKPVHLAGTPTNWAAYITSVVAIVIALGIGGFGVYQVRVKR